MRVERAFRRNQFHPRRTFRPLDGDLGAPPQFAANLNQVVLRAFQCRLDRMLERMRRGQPCAQQAVHSLHVRVQHIAMTTIGRFERALGRTALWAPYMPERKAHEKVRSYYVQRLRIYPHALREQNAYYSPDKKSLLFGYFQANRDNAGDNLPGGLVFCCLSHDVVAHETTHALLDGLHRYYQYQTNPDIAAFHEAFADIVALFQHFTIPAALKHRS